MAFRDVIAFSFCAMRLIFYFFTPARFVAKLVDMIEILPTKLPVWDERRSLGQS